MLHPWMLIGLAGLSVPIIIHLIQKQRLKPQQLATLQFLDREDLANAFAPVPRDMLQLLLRLLLLGLFILLMSRLVTDGDKVGPRTLAAILDQSLSMQQKVSENETLFQHYRKQILQMIDGLGPEDRLSLRLVGDTVTTETGYLRDKDELRNIAEKFDVSDSGSLGLMPAIAGAVDQLRSRREVNACVLVFSDQQRINYPNTADRAAFREQLDQSTVKVFLIDELPTTTANLAVERASFSPNRVYIGASGRLTAVVRNHTSEPQSTNVTIYDGDQAGQQRPLSLEAGEAAQIDLVQRFESPVDSACRVEIDDDLLSGDNRFHVPMRIKDRRQILLVATAASRDADSQGLELSYRGADLLAYALNPGEALGAGSGTNINVKRITPQMLDRVSLPIYSLIVLYGVTELPEQSLKDLEAFVTNGGGLWLIPDREMSPLRFNEAFSRLLKGVGAGQLKQPPQVQSLARGEAEITHPLLLPLLREEWGDANDLYFNEYFGIESQGTASVALRAANGDPLVLMVRRDRGNIFLQLFGCELESTSLPRSAAFVPLVQHVARALSERDESSLPDTMRVGEVLRIPLPEFRNLQGDVQAVGPEKKGFPLTGPEHDEIRVEGLRHAGDYSLEHPAKKSGRKRWLAVNPVLGESDLAAMTDEDQAALFGGDRVLRIPYSQVADQFSRQHEIGPPIAVLVMIAFAVEALLGAWQSRRGARRAEGQEGAA